MLLFSWVKRKRDNASKIENEIQISFSVPNPKMVKRKHETDVLIPINSLYKETSYSIFNFIKHCFILSHLVNLISGT